MTNSSSKHLNTEWQILPQAVWIQILLHQAIWWQILPQNLNTWILLHQALWWQILFFLKPFEHLQILMWEDEKTFQPHWDHLVFNTYMPDNKFGLSSLRCNGLRWSITENMYFPLAHQMLQNGCLVCLPEKNT
jgi:hypothetical protein